MSTQVPAPPVTVPSGFVEPVTAVETFLNIVSTFTLAGEDIKIYLTEKAVEKLGNLLLSLGFRYKPVERIQKNTKHVVIDVEDEKNIVIRVYEKRKRITEITTDVDKFIRELKKRMKKKGNGSKPKDKLYELEVDDPAKILDVLEDLREE